MHKTGLYFLIALVICACNAKKELKESPATYVTATMPQGLASEGKSLFITCAACHGSNAEGNIKLGAPALANTDDWYLYNQLMNFKKGIRGTHSQDTLGNQMAAVAGILKDSIAVANVVAFTKTLPKVILPALISGDIIKGGQYYQTICGSCHGPKAVGNQKMNAPRLSGLDDWYIERQISHFKKSIRGSHPGDHFGAQMIPMVALLPNDQSVRDVIAYIRSVAQPVSK